MRWLSSLVFLAVACGAQHVAPEVIQLARIKMKMNENLQHLPNYTCLQTIERSVRSAGTGRYKPVDTLRLEVALVGGKELFAFPGEQRFQEREISELAPGGAIGNGDFALHAKAVFLSNVATFEFVGREQREGRDVLKYSYRVPQFASGYILRVSSQQAVVGFRGVVWSCCAAI
jgi:hypothetical protein